jgi:bifunctional UDP-N-acetylglucosamine pyrophosphorylase/glucosamine-1-phosphate N-acetyltransferase/UDP-N-acetylglucosamine pyrophosphorylase
LKRIAAVIVAAGYGSFRCDDEGPVPKVIELLGGMPLLGHVATACRKAQLSPRIVVLNPLFGGRVWQTLVDMEREYGEDMLFALQRCRQGSAEAISCVLPLLQELGIGHFLAIYADMPFWKPTTLQSLAHLHLTEQATISLVSVKRDSSGQLDNFGRILHDEVGRISRIVEVEDASPEERDILTVNPSLWVWERTWFASHARKIPPRERWDGFHAEYHLPPLVGLARKEGKKVVEIPLEDPREALGVNTLAQLEALRSLHPSRETVGLS